MVLEGEYYEFVLREPEVYNNLVNVFRESDSFYRYLWEYNEVLFYKEFRLWLNRKCNCYNDGTNFLYFKTEQDYVWFRLKYG
jgi:hypothetical protein